MAENIPSCYRSMGWQGLHHSHRTSGPEEGAGPHHQPRIKGAPLVQLIWCIGTFSLFFLVKYETSTVYDFNAYICLPSIAGMVFFPPLAYSHTTLKIGDALLHQFSH
jgi:hypothetical protein